jgi:hypothetical protein
MARTSTTQPSRSPNLRIFRLFLFPRERVEDKYSVFSLCVYPDFRNSIPLYLGSFFIVFK